MLLSPTASYVSYCTPFKPEAGSLTFIDKTGSNSTMTNDNEAVANYKSCFPCLNVCVCVCKLKSRNINYNSKKDNLPK
jgi:hypothetical protein